MKTISISEMEMRNWTALHHEYAVEGVTPRKNAYLNNTIKKLWGGNLVPLMAPKNSRGRYAQATITCPTRAATGYLELGINSQSLPFRNTDAIENILCLEGPIEIKLGPKLEESVVLNRFDMLSIAVDVMHQIINIGQQTAKMVSVLNSGSDSHYPIVFNSQYRDSTFSIETLNKASVSFDNEVGQVFSREKIEASITRFAELVPYKNSLSSKSGIPPAATELLTASSVYPLIIPDGHIGRSQYAPLKGLPGLYMAIAECTPSDGPLPHAHYDSQESFFVLDGDWDITWGYEDEFRIPVKPYDLVAMPDQVMRSFKNTGKNKGWLFVIIQGQEKMSDIVAYSPEVGKIVEERYGADVIHAYQKVNITFDAERC